MRMYKSFLVSVCILISAPIWGPLKPQWISNTAEEAITNFKKNVEAIKKESVNEKLEDILFLVKKDYECDFHHYPEFKGAVRAELAKILKTKDAEPFLAKSSHEERTNLYLLGRFSAPELSEPLIGALIDAGRFDDQYPFWDAAVSAASFESGGDFFVFCDVVFALESDKSKMVIDKIAENRKDFFTDFFYYGSDEYNVDVKTKKCTKTSYVYSGNKYSLLHALIYWVVARDEKIKTDKENYKNFVMYLAKKALETSPEIVFAIHNIGGTVTHALSEELKKSELSSETKEILLELQSEIEKQVSVTMLARSLHALLS